MEKPKTRRKQSLSTNFECFESASLGEKYYKTVHSSGLTVLIYPKKLSTAYVMFSTRYGSLQRTFRLVGEQDFCTVPDGVAHFLEHKLFEEEDGSDAFAKFAPLGASANAFTSHELTSYLFSTTDRIDDALAVLLGFVTHPYFNEKSVQKEQGIIAQEIGMCKDNPFNRLYYAFLEGLYRENNVRVDIAGTVKTISEITPDILYRCYNTFYQLSNMVLTVSGDITPEAVLSVVDRVLPHTCEKHAIECQYPKEDATVAKPYAELYMSVATPMLAFGAKDLTEFDSVEEKIRYGILAEMLGKCYFSRSSDYYNTLYDEGLIAKSINYSFDMLSSCSYLMISAESEKPLEVFERTKLLLENIPKNLPSESDFLRIQRVMYANFIRGFDSTESISFALTDTFIQGGDVFLTGEIISSVTYEEFTRFACDFLKGKEFSLSVIYPFEKEEA